MDIKEVYKMYVKLPNNFKTTDLDNLIKEIKEYDEISYDYNILSNNYHMQRIFFYHNLSLIKDKNLYIDYIDKYKDLMYCWESADQLITKLKYVNIDKLLEYSLKYKNNNNPFITRSSYVMFISHKEKKNRDSVYKILNTICDEKEHTNKYAIAWLLCELAIYNSDIIYDYLKESNINYDIKRIAISKMYDSFRIDRAAYNKFKELKEELMKLNSDN